MQIIGTKRNRIKALSLEYQLFYNKNPRTWKFYSRHCKERPSSFFYKNYCIPKEFLMLFRFHKFASFHIICIFSIQRSSLVSRYCEYISDNIGPWDFQHKRMILIMYQKDGINISKTFLINYVKVQLYAGLQLCFMN